MSNNFGTVNFEGKELKITQEAYVDNYGTDGEVRYYANAVDTDGNEYQVTWETTKEFDQSEVLFHLIEELEVLKSHKSFDEGMINRIDELEAEIEKMENDGIGSSYCEDGSNACNWDEPFSIERV